MELTNKEKCFLGIIRLNKKTGRNEIDKTFNIGKFKINFNWRSKNNLRGRFGGGWNWELGIQIGSQSIILNCLTFKIRIYYKQSTNQEAQ